MRRVLVVGACLLAAAALLLLHAAPARLANQPLPLVLQPTPPQHNETKRPSSSSSSSSSTNPPKKGPLMIRDVWSGGHSRAHADLCPSLGAHVALLVLVSSAPSHSSRRDAIRRSWGSAALRSDTSIAFVLGDSPQGLQQALDQEDALYGDLVQGRFVDAYANLTLKTLSMLEWASTYCPRAPHLLKTDDDMFINLPYVRAFVGQRRNATKAIWGKVVRNWLPKRAPSSKYFVSPQQFPPKVFPPFATGPAYVVTADAVRPLLQTALTLRFVPLEDVLVTGIAASAAHVSRTHAPAFLNRAASPAPCALQKTASLHMVRPEMQLELWRRQHAHCAH